MDIKTEVRGLKETQQRMERIVRDLRGTPFQDGMRDATLVVTREAKINAPVDTGRLRASITPEIRPHGNTVEGVVGSNVSYSAFVELGTRPHWVPWGALAAWASRHGISEYAVRLAIARRGTKAIKYLERAVTEHIPEIIGKISHKVLEIVEK